LAKTIYGVAPKQHINMSEFTEMLNMMTTIMGIIAMMFYYSEYVAIRRRTVTLIPITYTPEVQEVSQEEANPVIDEWMAEPAPAFNELPVEDEPVVDLVEELMEEPAHGFNELVLEEEDMLGLPLLQEVLPEPEVRLIQGAVGEQGAVYRVVWQNPQAEHPVQNQTQPQAQPQAQPQRRQRRRTQRPARANHTSVKNTKKYARENNLVGENCPICLEEFKSQCTLHKTRCNHHFHPKCLKQLKEQYRNLRRIRCPICRTNL